MPGLPKLSTVAILTHIAGHDDDANYGLAIAKATGYPSGTVVPALTRLAERDGYLQRTPVPTNTGRPRLVFRLTDEGEQFVRPIVEAFCERIVVLPLEATGGTDHKVNTSTIWILAVAAREPVTGTDTRLAPLTHQAAYVELERMANDGLLEPGPSGFIITDTGRGVAAHIRSQWEPRLDAAALRLTGS